METISRSCGSKKTSRGPRFTGIRVTNRGRYGFVEFEISNRTVSTVFRQPQKGRIALYGFSKRGMFYKLVTSYRICIYIYIYIYLFIFIYTYVWIWIYARIYTCTHIQTLTVQYDIDRLYEKHLTPNLPTNVVDFRGLDSSIILNLRGGIPRHRDFLEISPEDLTQAMLVGIKLVGRLGVYGLHAAEARRSTATDGSAAPA